MKLRHTPRSPFVRKVMVVAHEHGLVDRIELVPTSLSPVQGNDALALENPLMKVPSLVTDDGEVLFDSPVICEYLDDMAAGRKLFPAAGPARWAALRQQALGDGITDAVVLCAYETVRPEDKRWTGWTEGQMRKAHQGLAAIEREDLSGPHMIGHIAIGIALSYLDFRFGEVNWRDGHPHLATWHGTFDARPSVVVNPPVDDR